MCPPTTGYMYHVSEYGTMAAKQLGWRIVDRRTMTLQLRKQMEAVNDNLHNGWTDALHLQVPSHII